jgi:hypothetical protein
MATIENATEIRPFRVEVPQQEIGELRRRMGATRWPEGETVADGSQGGGATVPAAVSVFPRELYQAPWSWTEQAYPNLIYFNEVNKGNYLAACKSLSSSPPRCEPHSGHCARMEGRHE